MSTAETNAIAQQLGTFRGWWVAWQARRRKTLIRQRAQVRFRLTREGIHFVGVLLFIFIGAVIRDINLLILLAGAMIGLLLLQWRFNTRTLLRLDAIRRMPHTTTAGTETSVRLSVSNPKRLLGAWLVLVEDPLQQIQPEPERLADKGMAVLDEIRPRGVTHGNYRLLFRQRGRYRIGPSMLSTRFPIGLGRGWRILDNEAEVFVHPRPGELTPKATALFHQELHGHSKSSSKSGVNEAEFFGLRPWETGDSRRWIHWRTTARLGELSVRQFERQQHRQLCVLLDLHKAVDEPHHKANMEKAISFVATLAKSSVLVARDKLDIAIAAKSVYTSTGIKSPVLVESLLDELAVVNPSEQPDLWAAIQSITLPLLSNPALVVVSTRENQMSNLRKQNPDSVEGRLLSRLKIRWLNVNTGDLDPYFRWPESQTETTAIADSLDSGTLLPSTSLANATR